MIEQPRLQRHPLGSRSSDAKDIAESGKLLPKLPRLILN